jgi:hypothetical protein
MDRTSLQVAFIPQNGFLPKDPVATKGFEFFFPYAFWLKLLGPKSGTMKQFCKILRFHHSMWIAFGCTICKT